MDWTDATKPLARRLYERLDDDLRSLLLEEFRRYEQDTDGLHVSNAGALLWDSLNAESYGNSDFCDAFADTCAIVLRSALDAAPLAGRSIALCRCPFHQDRYNSLCSALATGAPWLVDFLSVVVASTHSIRGHLRSSDSTSDPTRELSHFRPLHTFVREFLRQHPHTGIYALLARHLHPDIGRSSRMRMLRQGAFGQLYGNVGGFPSLSAHTRVIQCACNEPFATFTSEVTNRFDRHSPPDEVLLAIGHPYVAGSYWIELIIDAVRVAEPHGHDRKLGVPTFPDAAGWWPYFPFRDHAIPPRWNHCRHLIRNTSALPEVLYAQLPIEDIEDAIVWAQPTAHSWYDRMPAYIEGTPA